MSEEKLMIELESALQEIEEKTNFKKKDAVFLFFFEKRWREKERMEREELGKLFPLMIQVLYGNVLSYSVVKGPGAPIYKFLRPSSTFSEKEEILWTSHLCEWSLISSSMVSQAKEVKNGLLMCKRGDSFYFNLINPDEKIGDRVSVEEYDKEIPNSNFCTLRKFYAPTEIFRISENQLYSLTRERLKEKFKNYEADFEVLFKTFNPIYGAYRRVVFREVEEITKKLLGEPKLPYLF